MQYHAFVMPPPIFKNGKKSGSATKSDSINKDNQPQRNDDLWYVHFRIKCPECETNKKYRSHAHFVPTDANATNKVTDGRNDE